MTLLYFQTSHFYLKFHPEVLWFLDLPVYLCYDCIDVCFVVPSSPSDPYFPLTRVFMKSVCPDLIPFVQDTLLSPAFSVQIYLPRNEDPLKSEWVV